MEFTGGSDNYLITGEGHPFLSAEHTFHTPSLGDEVFEIPPISLDPDSALTVGEVVSHFELSEGTGGPAGSSGLVNNPVVGANDPSFASTYVTPGSQSLEHLSLGMTQGGGGALLSSSALELSNSIGSHFSSSSPMTIDVPLSDINHGLLGSNQLSTIDQSELGLGLGGGNILSRSKSPDQPLSATPSPAGSIQDEDMEDFRKSVLVDSPMPFSSSSSAVTHMSSLPAPSSLVSVTAARRGGGKRATAAQSAPAAGKTGRRKKDPNEPQKPVSAYALFFRDTQAAIKGQNPSATFGEVSKIVASMWDSLGEDQKQVYKRKTDAAKKEYLKALAAYKANQLSQPSADVIDTSPSPPPQPQVIDVTPVAPPPMAPQQSRLSQYNPEENTITNICASNIILDVPEVTTRSRTLANKPAPQVVAPPSQTVTKIIISKQMLSTGGQVVAVLPAGVRSLHPGAMTASRQPPPLQQMQGAPPPPRLQQMAPAPPPLQAKPREGGGGAPGLSVSVTSTPPPPLQIKIVPASLQGGAAVPIIVKSATAASAVGVASGLPASVRSASAGVASSSELPGNAEDDVVAEELMSGEVEMDFSESSDGPQSVCVRAGCNNPVVESEDWDREYCSNECVATHCRDTFMAWCSIRNQNTATVK